MAGAFVVPSVPSSRRWPATPRHQRQPTSDSIRPTLTHLDILRPIWLRPKMEPRKPKNNELLWNGQETTN